MGDYSTIALAKKLGIKSGSRLSFVNIPRGFHDLLQPLPEGAQFGSLSREPYDVIILFSTRKTHLMQELSRRTQRLATNGGLWVAWPRAKSKIATDLEFEVVQRAGLDLGLVDNKVCAIDDDWTALRFVIRVLNRSAIQQSRAETAADDLDLAQLEMQNKRPELKSPGLEV